MPAGVILHSSASKAASSRLRLRRRCRQKSIPTLRPGRGPRVLAPTTGAPTAGRAVSAGDAPAPGDGDGAGGPWGGPLARTCDGPRVRTTTTADSAHALH